MQFQDRLWCPLEKFFQRDKGRITSNNEVFLIIDNFGERLQQLLDNVEVADNVEETDKITIAVALSALDPMKGSARPAVFQDIKIFAEGTAPGLASAFLVTNDSNFYQVVATVLVEAEFASAVREVLGVSIVPRVVMAETVVNGM